MSMRWPLLALAAVATAALGCGKSSTAPEPASFAGSWQATRVEYRATQSSDVQDIIAAGGTGSLVLGADGTFQLTLAPVDDEPFSATGTWQASGDEFTLTPTNVPNTQWQFSFSLSATVLTLSGADADYDFDKDGTMEAAKLYLTLSRSGG